MSKAGTNRRGKDAVGLNAIWAAAHDGRGPGWHEVHQYAMSGATCTLIFPHGALNRFYGDPTHCEWLSLMGAPDHGDDRNFQAPWGDALEPRLMTRKTAEQEFAPWNFKETALSIISEFVARKRAVLPLVSENAR